MINVLRAGRVSYEAGLRLQAVVRDGVRSGSMKDTLIILEHDPVYTVGIRDKSYTEEEEAKLRALGADFHRTNRGGLITFHGPGQMVVYPILDLRNYNPSVRWYICTLEEIIIQLCSKFGLNASRSVHTGVWVNDAKICAMGVHASRYITTHGLAFNCNTDLSWFSHIVPCGIPDKEVTSLSHQLGKEVTIQETIPHFLSSFNKEFSTTSQEITLKDVPAPSA